MFWWIDFSMDDFLMDRFLIFDDGYWSMINIMFSFTCQHIWISPSEPTKPSKACKVSSTPAPTRAKRCTCCGKESFHGFPKKEHNFWPTKTWNFGCFRCLPEMILFLGVSKIPFLGVSKTPSIINHSFWGGNPKIRGGYPKNGWFIIMDLIMENPIS